MYLLYIIIISIITVLTETTLTIRYHEQPTTYFVTESRHNFFHYNRNRDHTTASKDHGTNWDGSYHRLIPTWLYNAANTYCSRNKTEMDPVIDTMDPTQIYTAGLWHWYWSTTRQVLRLVSFRTTKWNLTVSVYSQYCLCLHTRRA